MALIVQKYGGTSVGSIDRIRNVAQRIAKTRAAGNDVIAVVSAMSGETDRLLGLGADLSEAPADREVDVLVASGEQVSSALLSIALNEMGVKARSMQGHQAQIRTDAIHRKARIRAISSDRLQTALDEGNVIVVAGFQGVDDHGNITTLGRGGSDTSAVAIAAAANADVCEIYTDVDGIYTTDPRICPDARKVNKITHDEMLELASLGAKVLQIRSVELARKYNMDIHLRSSFSDAEGTIVTGEDAELESVVVAGVAADKKEVKVTVRTLPDHPGVVAELFEPLAQAAISVDMIIQNVSSHGATDLTFTITGDDTRRAEEIASEVSKRLGGGEVLLDSNVAKVSIVGLGMRSHAGVAAKMFRLLADNEINIEAISTSEIKTSCLIREELAEKAVRVLHDGFGLADEPSS